MIPTNSLEKKQLQITTQFSLLLIGAFFAVTTGFLAGCESESLYSSSQAYVEVEPIAGEDALEDQETFFRLPWPNDLRQHVDGTLDLAGFPVKTPFMQDYLLTFDGIIHGFATQGAVYFRFSGGLDEKSIPTTPGESLEEASSVFLVDVSEESPTYRQKVPVQVSYKESRQSVGSFSLVLLPFHGFPLRPKTTYAAIVTTSVKGADGKPVKRGRDMKRLLSDSTPSSGADGLFGTAWEVYLPLRQYLEAVGREKTDVAAAAVFTTQEPVSLMGAIREVIYEDLPDHPTPLELEYTTEASSYFLFSGTYEGPVFQAGEPPYRRSGGVIELDDDGRPILVRTEPIRFAVSIPKGEIPEKGWPVVIYSHGTGGDFLSFHRSGVAANLAQVLDHDDVNVMAKFAMLGVDQVQHGTRCGEMTCNPEMDFFNFSNPLAGRDNVRQGALDNFQIVRLLANMDIQAAPDIEVPIKFDSDTIFFMGHSQGGLTGPPFLAYEPAVKGAVLSGAGGNMILSLLQKDEPVDIPTMVTLMLGEDYAVDRFNPGLTLIQTFIEPSDAVNYGRLIIDEPPQGCTAKSIYQSQGIVDRYTPPDLMEALGISMGLTWVEPEIIETPGFTLAEQPNPVARPISGNKANGEATGVFVQYAAPEGRDGHFVVFDLEEARRDYGLFLATMANTGIPVFR